MKQSFIKYYEYFQQKISGNARFEFKPNLQQNKWIDNFLKLIPETAGENWMFDYLLFQFNKYHDRKTRFGDGVVLFSWVIGKSALESYKQRSEQEIYFMDKFKQSYNIRTMETNKESIKEEINGHKLSLRNRKSFISCSNSVFDLKDIFSKICCTGCKSYGYCELMKVNN